MMYKTATMPVSSVRYEDIIEGLPYLGPDPVAKIASILSLNTQP
jgi:hypothetical protein